MPQNLPLQTALETITEHPEVHDQSIWARTTSHNTRYGELIKPETKGPRVDCGTVMCVAGLGCIQNGYAFVQTAYDGHVGALNAVVKLTPDMPKVIEVDYSKYDLRNAAAVGQEVFGLDDAEADAMFVSGNNIQDLWALAYAVTDGDISLVKAKDEYGNALTAEVIEALLEEWEYDPDSAPSTDENTHAQVAEGYFVRAQANV